MMKCGLTKIVENEDSSIKVCGISMVQSCEKKECQYQGGLQQIWIQDNKFEQYPRYLKMVYLCEYGKNLPE